MGRIWMPGGGGGADLDVVTAGTGDVLAGKVIVGPDGEPLTGTMANQGAKTAALNCGGSYMIPAGYHNGAGKVTANSLASQTPGNLAANKMLAGTYGYSNGARVDGNIASQGALTLNPGTTVKTGSVSGKYMTGNITVPAISIPANYIKKNQRITFPDGSYVNGTFEGWVPTATDLYLRGQNPAGFTGNSYYILESGSIAINNPQGYQFQITSAVSYNWSQYTKINVELMISNQTSYKLNVMRSSSNIIASQTGTNTQNVSFTVSLDITNAAFTDTVSLSITSSIKGYFYHIWFS